MGDEIYRIKWDNQELADVVEARRFAASELRRESTILRRLADQIDDEIQEWTKVLEIVTPEPATGEGA